MDSGAGSYAALDEQGLLKHSALEGLGAVHLFCVLEKGLDGTGLQPPNLGCEGPTPGLAMRQTHSPG